MNFDAFGGVSQPNINTSTSQSQIFDNLQFSGNIENVPLKPINPIQPQNKEPSFQPPVTQVN